MADPGAAIVIESKKKHKQTAKKFNVNLEIESSQGMSAVQLAQKMVTQLTT
jgi:hypothetical protein